MAVPEYEEVEWLHASGTKLCSGSSGCSGCSCAAAAAYVFLCGLNYVHSVTQMTGHLWDTFFVTRAVVFSLIILASTVLAYSQTANLYKASRSEPFSTVQGTQQSSVDTLLATMRLHPRGDVPDVPDIPDVPDVPDVSSSQLLDTSPDITVSSTPTTASTDHELRDALYKERDSITGWKAMAEHALSERDVGGSSSLPAFPALDSVISHPIKAYDEAMAGGTSLVDAARTSVGSILPKFSFSEFL